MRTAIAALALMLTAAQAEAATLTMTKVADLWPFISISGQLEMKDAQTFIALAETVKNNPADYIHAQGMVVLEGPGGSVAAAIEIGQYIRDHGWGTIVPADKYCMSACGLIWLGGKSRTLDVGARVGFHSAYDLHGSDQIASIGANAIVGAYMGRLGLSYDAIYYLTNTAPTSIQLLENSDAKKYGITFGRPPTPQITGLLPATTEPALVQPASLPATTAVQAPAPAAPQQTAPIALITAPLDFHARTWPQIADQYISQQPDIDFGSCNQQQVIRALQITMFGQPVWAWAEVGCSPTKRAGMQSEPIQLPDDFVQVAERFVTRHPDWDFSGCTRRTLATAIASSSFGGSTGCMPKPLSSKHAE